MSIAEKIRTKRLQKGWTQEQVASSMGVTAQAVHKWEKGVSYPDILSLMPLARLLDMDLNELFGFYRDPSKEEIAGWMKELADKGGKLAPDEIYEIAMEKIRAFPHSYELCLSLALTLQGIGYLYLKREAMSEWRNRIKGLFDKAAESGDDSLRCMALSQLISMTIQEGEYEAAESMLGQLPDKPAYDKELLQTQIYLQQREYDKAAELTEKRILSLSTMLLSSLLTLSEIAAEEGKEEEAQEIAKTAEEAVSLFHLWEYNKYLPRLSLCIAKKDDQGLASLIEEMEKDGENGWDISSSVLYRHIQAKDERGLGRVFTQMIKRQLRDKEDGEPVFSKSFQ